MSTTSNPFGFIPQGHLGGGTVRTKSFGILSQGGQVGYSGATTSSTMYRGQIVYITTSGLVAPAATNTAVGVGVFAGIEYIDSTGHWNEGLYWSGPSGTSNVRCYVWIDPMIEFKVQLDGAPSTPLAMLYATANLSATNTTSGSTYSGQSTCMLSATYSTSSTGMFQVTDYWGAQGNAYTDAYPIVLCHLAQSPIAYPINGQ